MAPLRQPHYPPAERMAILELRAARGWSLQETADAFQLTAPTIASWMQRVDEGGADALVQIRVLVNNFPDFVRYVVQRLRVLCPTMGKVKMAQTLTRAGLHVGATTVGRMLKDKPLPEPEVTEEAKSVDRVVTSKYPTSCRDICVCSCVSDCQRSFGHNAFWRPNPAFLEPASNILSSTFIRQRSLNHHTIYEFLGAWFSPSGVGAIAWIDFDPGRRRRSRGCCGRKGNGWQRQDATKRPCGPRCPQRACRGPGCARG